MSDRNSFHTPRKSSDDSSCVATMNENPHSSHLSNRNEYNFSDDNVSSRFDCRKHIVTGKGCDQPRRSPRIIQKASAHKKKIIKRVSKLPAKHKYNSKKRYRGSGQRNDSLFHSVNYDVTRNTSSFSSPTSISHISNHPNSTSNKNINTSNGIEDRCILHFCP